MRLARASAITVVVVFVISAALTWSAFRGNLLAPLIVSLVPCLFGIAIGAGGFSLARGFLGQGFVVRLVSGVFCGVVACILDGGLILIALRKAGNQEFYEAGLIGLAYTALVAGVVGTVFGSGIGQAEKRQGV